MASNPVHHMRSCSSGVASTTHPSMVYGKLSGGTRPSTWSMVKNGTPSHDGSSSYQPSPGSGTPARPSARLFITRYWVEKSASRKSRWRVGATRTTSRRRSGRAVHPSRWRVQRMVSLENPLEAGASTSVTTGSAPEGSLVASQRESVAATSSGSRPALSGTGGA